MHKREVRRIGHTTAFAGVSSGRAMRLASTAEGLRKAMRVRSAAAVASSRPVHEVSNAVIYSTLELSTRTVLPAHLGEGGLQLVLAI
jgi:hypothetical protein